MSIFAEKIDIIYFLLGCLPLRKKEKQANKSNFDYLIMTKKEFVRKVFSPIVGLNLLGMILLVVLVGLGTTWWMKSYTRHGEGIDVPDVKGILVNDAKIALTGMELDCIVIDSTYDAKLAPGIVIKQTPGPGSRVKAGREIYVTINAKNEPTLPIPNIIDNCSLREAEAKLLSLGFKLGACEYVQGQQDWVMGIKCRGVKVMAGERVPINTPIVLMVGNSQIEVDENEVTYEDDWTNPSDAPVAPATSNTFEEEIVF